MLDGNDIRQSVMRSRHFYLFVSLIAFFIVNPFLVDNRISNVIMLIFFLFIIFFSVYSVVNKTLFVVISFLAILAFASYWYILWINQSVTAFVTHFIFNILFLTLLTFSVISSVTRQHEITPDTLFGAICGYLLIGFIWSYFYLVIASIDPASFSLHIAHEPIRSHIDHFIYYSFVTLTTLGYGDIIALKSVARTFSWLEAVIGQVYLAVWISQLVGLRIMQFKKF